MASKVTHPTRGIRDKDWRYRNSVSTDIAKTIEAEKRRLRKAAADASSTSETAAATPAAPEKLTTTPAQPTAGTEHQQFVIPLPPRLVRNRQAGRLTDRVVGFVSGLCMAAMAVLLILERLGLIQSPQLG